MKKTYRIKLTHACRRADCFGEVGEVLTVSRKQRDFLLERGGCIDITPAPQTDRPSPPESEPEINLS